MCRDEPLHESSNDAERAARSDEELGSRSCDRLEYEPSSIWMRLAVGLRFKRHLATSTHLLHVEYRVRCKYFLISVLVVCGAFLTPQLLPRWLGFELSSAQDLCKFRDEKLEGLRSEIQNLTNMPAAETFEAKQAFLIECMNKSAASFYHGASKSPPRYLWPSECTKENAKASFSRQECTEPTEIDECKPLGGFLGTVASVFGKCGKETLPSQCSNVTDKDSFNALMDLEEKRHETLQLRPNQNATEIQTATEDMGGQLLDMVAGLIRRVDFAGNLFILYSILAVLVGTPLIVYKREKTSRILGASFSLRKGSFIVLVVDTYSVYEALLPFFNNVDVAFIFRNFSKDPCWVDSDFSRSRHAIVFEACNNVSALNMKIELNTLNMNLLYYNVSLFGLCADSNRNKSVHPNQESMNFIRRQYDEKRLQSPGLCNATELDHMTATPPQEANFSLLRFLTSNGVIAQLLIKFILTRWVVHLVAFLEPMVLHSGKVEIWGRREDDGLSKKESAALSRFVRDRHLIQLIFFTILMVLEGILIIYSVVDGGTPPPGMEAGKPGDPKMEMAAASFTCPFRVS